MRAIDGKKTEARVTRAFLEQEYENQGVIPLVKARLINLAVKKRRIAIQGSERSVPEGREGGLKRG